MAGLEVDLAKRIVAWFQAQSWDVYQEVEFRGHIADLVVTQGPAIGVVECKRRYGFAVLEQAVSWKGWANYIWIATWWGKTGAFGQVVAQKFGVGLLRVVENWSSHNDLADSVQREIPPAFNRKLPSSPRLRDVLREEHKSGIYAQAGTNTGNRFTPFKSTCQSLARVVAANPGITLREALGEISHHYASVSSGVGSLVHWIESGKVPGVRLEREGRKLRLQVAP